MTNSAWNKYDSSSSKNDTKNRTLDGPLGGEKQRQDVFCQPTERPIAEVVKS